MPGEKNAVGARQGLSNRLSAELLSGWGPEALTRFSAIFNLYDLDETGAIDRENYAHLLDRIEKKEGRPVGVPFIINDSD